MLTRRAHLESQLKIALAELSATKEANVGLLQELDVNESKLKIALVELKTTKETNVALLKELDDHEADMSCMLAQQNDLKQQLGEQNVVFEDLRDQRDCLQCTLDSYLHDQEMYEAALRRISDLEQELNLNKAKLEELECVSKNAERIENNINNQDLYSELILATPGTSANISIPIIDLTTPKIIKNTGSICMSGSNKIKKYVKVKKLLKRLTVMSKRYKNYFKCTNICKQKLDLQVELKECYNLLGRNNRELDYMSNRMNCLHKSLHDLNIKYELSNKQNEAHIAATATLATLTSSGCSDCCSNVPDIPLPCHILSSVTAQDGPDHSVAVRKSPLPEPVLPCLPAPASRVNKDASTGAAGSTRRTVVYSDELGVGMGRLLHNNIRQPVCNNSYRNLPCKELVEKIKNSVYDSNTTLIVQLGNSIGTKKADIISLIETLLDVQSRGIGRIINCSFPYSNKLTKAQNDHVHDLNLTLYNLTCRHSDFLYFESNNFISRFILTKDTLYLSKNEKMIIARLLAYNIHDPVINSIAGHSDTALVSNVSNQAIGSVSSSVDLN